MRVTERRKGGFGYHKSWSLPEDISPWPPIEWVDEVPDAELDILRRSDVTHNVNIAGWRPPSNYQAVKIQLYEWSGSAGQVSDYQDGNKLKKFIGRRDEGYRSVNPSDVIFRPLPTSPSPFPNNLRARTEVQALLKAKNQVASFGASLAEARKAASGLADNVVSIVSSLRALRRGNLKQAAKALSVNHKWAKVAKAPNPSVLSGLNKASKEVASRWLELQYAWLPLMGDIHTVYDSVTGQTRAEFGFSFHVTKRQKQEESSSSSYSGYNWSRTITVKDKFECYVRLDYNLDMTALRAVDRFGLLNPYEVAWELVPFSFVVDWFLPLGDFFTAIGMEPGVSFRGGSLTEYTETIREASATTLVNDINNLNRGDSINGSYSSYSSCRNTERSTYRMPPFPTPYIKNPFSVGHGVNALALMRSFFK